MTDTLNILVGAGFSYYAGLPLGNNIKVKFEQPFRDRIIKASSSEWFWVEGQDETMVHNGRLNTDHLEYAFIMDEIVKTYKVANKNQFVDYEDFYQYIKENTGIEGWYEPIIASARQRFYSETNATEDNQHWGYAFRNPERYRPQEIINYLIADLLQIKKTEQELIVIYSPFISFIKKYSTVNIFSLNHDRVFENLFRLFGLQHCDGFTTNNSSLKYEGAPLLTFQNEFTSSAIRLFKLHGSIDTYLYEHGTEQARGLIRDGNYTYFKPNNYYAKHHAIRIDPITSQVIQQMNFDIVPKFITGKNKKAFIQADNMYSEMYKKYEEEIKTGNDLLIAGYSFRDAHMNEELQNFTKVIGSNIINLNYGDKYPFQAPSVMEINNFNQLP